MKKVYPRWESPLSGETEFIQRVGKFDLHVYTTGGEQYVIVVWGTGSSWAPYYPHEGTDEQGCFIDGWHVHFIRDYPPEGRDKARQVAEAYAKLLS